MDMNKAILHEIKEDLEAARKPRRGMTAKQIMLELAPTIHEQMRAGVKLMDLYTIIKEKLPEEAMLSPTTFRKYWRDARLEIGLAPLKASGPQSPRQAAGGAPVPRAGRTLQPSPETVSRPQPKGTAGDFRVDKEDF